MIPTGFGKSAIFQLTPFLLGQRQNSQSTITIVVSPLNSIMEDQVQKLCAAGIPACFLNMTCTNGETYKFLTTSRGATS